ncbi:MAG TPA: hypothetical protein VJT11_07430 [Nitrospiraceae bacterium]|nr:hypothetical protein [Nitrospiraceae bacterium]
MNEWSRRVSVTVLCGWLTIVGLACAVQSAAAQEPATESRPRVDLAIGTWISVGETRWAHDASSSFPLLGNPTSQLAYKDVGTNVFDMAGTLWITPRLFGRLNVGVAGIGGGRLTDNDYLAADGGNPSLQTISDLSGDGMWYLNADAGGRVTNFPNHRGWLDVFGGFQYWHTKYTAVGLGQLICTTAGSTVDLGGGNVLCNPSGPSPPVGSGTEVITNTTNWYSLRVGGRTEYRLTRQLSLLGSVALLPLSIIENKDIHHLRMDLQQNPSISMLGFGMGVDADVGAKFMFTKNVGVNVGYRVWWNRMIDGDVTIHAVTGSSEFALTEFQSYRHGLTAGLNIIF